MQVDYDSLFTALRTEKEIEVLINPFVNAYLNDVMEQLEGHNSSRQDSYGKTFLASYIMYYREMILSWT